MHRLRSLTTPLQAHSYASRQRSARRAKMEIMRFEVVRDGFVARISGLDPAGSLEDEVVGELVEALDNYGVLVFPRTQLDDDSLVAFGASFGELEDFGAYSGRLEPRMVRVGNVDDNGNIRAADDRLRAMAVADGLWHVDSSYREVPARYSMLLAKRVAAVGGATEFADTYAAYEALPDHLKKQLEHGVAVHDFHRSRARAGYELSEDERTALPPARQPVLRTNPRTGRVSLYIASHIRQFEGMSTEQSEELLQELVELATRPERVYVHSWQVGDVVIWDNPSVMHRRAPYDDFAEARELIAARVLEPAALVP
jgi:alpha-ketoglutarate-dependent 2,4-dichlorophenoxyacetate dioxygenase